MIAQFPTNLYLRGERELHFKGAQSIETKFGSDPKRLLAVARFYMGIERAADAVRIAGYGGPLGARSRRGASTAGDGPSHLAATGRR